MNKWSMMAAALILFYVLFQVQVGGIAQEEILGLVVEEEVAREVVKSVDEGETIEEMVAEEETKLEEPEPLKILAFGDIMLGRYVRTLMDKHGKDYVFENLGELRDLYPLADVVFGNLEGPIFGAGRSGGTAMVFSFNEDVAPWLKEKGFDLLSIANNHAVDMGWEGRGATMKALSEAGVGFCGHPSEADPESVYYGEVGEEKFAFVCFSSVKFRLDQEAAVELIKKVREEVDYLVVSIHWGVEYQPRPHKTLQVETAHAFIDAGADLIIGHHPHIIQPIEVYKDRLIIYSLGNFVFDQYWAQVVQEELGVAVELKRDKDDEFRTTLRLIPMKSENSQVRLMNEEEKTRWIEQFLLYADYDEAMVEMLKQFEVEI